MADKSAFRFNFGFADKEVFNYGNHKEFYHGDVLDKYPETAEAFFSIGMHCLGCPASRGETIEEACMVHGANADELIDVLNQIANK